MSRIGKSPVAIPPGVEVNISADRISVKGPLGTLSQQLSSGVTVEKADNVLRIVRKDETRQSNAMSGTLRAILANMVHGVTKGFERKLNLVGVGYRAAMKGNAISAFPEKSVGHNIFFIPILTSPFHARP